MQDIVWKRIIETLFQDFVAFFLPDVFPHIDFSKPYVFLDKEFQKLFPETKKGKRYLDKLVKVFLNSGQEQWILIHTEVQGYQDDTFAHRMFVYFYRIFDKYQRKVISLAILADEKPGWKPERFDYQFFQTELTYKYLTYKLLEQEEESLKASNNPFALAVLASLYTMRSKRSEDKRLRFKLELTRLLLEKKFSAIKIESVFQFIHTLLKLNDEMKQNIFVEEVHKMATKEKTAELLTDYEEAILRKGRKEGEITGEIKNKKETARKMKADGLPIQTISKYTGLSHDVIEKLEK